MGLFSKSSSSATQVTTTNVSDMRTAGGSGGITAGPSSSVSIVGADAQATIKNASDILRTGMEGVYDFAESALGMALSSSEKATQVSLATSGNVAERSIATAAAMSPAPDWARVVPWLVTGAVAIALVYAYVGRR